MPAGNFTAPCGEVVRHLPVEAVVGDHQQRDRVGAGRKGAEGGVLAAVVHVGEEAVEGDVVAERFGAGDGRVRGEGRDFEAAIGQLQVVEFFVDFVAGVAEADAELGLFRLAAGHEVDLQAGDGAGGNFRGDAAVEFHGADARDVAGDQPGVHAPAADRHVAEVRVMDDARVAGLDFDGLQVGVV